MAVKKIYKSELMTEYQRKLASREFPLHCSLNHDNIVKAYEWCEDESQYALVMEYLNQPNYFKDKIDQVVLFFFPFINQQC